MEELAAQCSTKPDAIVLSVGGGGLLQGVVQGLDKVHLMQYHAKNFNNHLPRLAGLTCPL